MPELAKNEFWKDLKPIDKVFQPDAQPEVYLQNAPTDDERYYVPFTETVSSRPLWISPTQNKWCDILMAKKAGLASVRPGVSRMAGPPMLAAGTARMRWPVSARAMAACRLLPASRRGSTCEL